MIIKRKVTQSHMEDEEEQIHYLDTKTCVIGVPERKKTKNYLKK